MIEEERTLSVLIIEDSDSDAALLEMKLKKEYRSLIALRVEEEDTLRQALSNRHWDIILSDYKLPHFTGIEALLIVRKNYPDVPFIFVSGTMGEALAVEAIKAGASDYIVKGQLERLFPAITRELAEVARKQERIKLEKELLQQKSLSNEIFHGDLTAMALLDNQDMVFNANERFKTLFALDNKDRQSFKISDYMERETLDKFHEILANIKESKQSFTDTMSFFDHNEKPIELMIHIIPYSKEHDDYFLLQAIDVEQSLQDKIIELKTHDEVTGLANQTLFCENVQRAIALCQLQDKKIAIAAIHIARFDFYREAFGINASNELLMAITGCLQQGLVNSGAILGKGAISVFYVMRIVNQWQEEYPKTFIEKIKSIFADKISCGDQMIEVDVNVGVSIYPFHGDNSEELITAAELAMHEAKESGFNQNRVFDFGMQQKFDTQKRLQFSMQAGLEGKEFLNYYQPKFSAINKKIIGVEALLRWHHGEVFISPQEFITFAEKEGMIVPLGYYAFKRALEDYRYLREKVPTLSPYFQIAVNLSVKQFAEPKLLNTLKELLDEHEVPIQAIELEITESALLEEPLQQVRRINALKEMGFSLAIDDFGTGYSSLRYLKDLPADTVKIDKSFIDDIPHDSRTCAIVHGVIDVIHHLGMKVVAEGVENEAQLTFLQQHGCDIIQGFLLSRPLALSRLQELMQQKIQ